MAAGVAGLLALGSPGLAQGREGPTIIPAADYGIELFADFSKFGRLKAFDMLIMPRGSEYPMGLYVTSGPTGDDRSDRLVYISPEGDPSIFADGLTSNESIVHAGSDYGDTLLVSEPLTQTIRRVGPDGSVEDFARVGTEPFGPAGMFFDGADRLLVTDFSANSLLAVNSDGASELVAELPSLTAPPEVLFFGAKGGDDCETPPFCGGGFGGGGAGGSFVIGVFTASDEPVGAGGVYRVSTHPGVSPELMFDGLDGVNLLEWGPGGPYGSDLYVPFVGTGATADGGVSIWDPVFGLQSFLIGVDAAAIAFDTAGVLGGGMFVSDMRDGVGAGRIWRIFEKD